MKILQQLLRDGEVTVERLAKRFKMSSATIRRELTNLERVGLLRRTHGGAIQVEPMLYEPFRYLDHFRDQEMFQAAEKRRIGLVAAEMIKDGEVVALGAGTTTTQVGRNIRHRKGITVVTNAINIAMELSHRQDLKIIVIGGVLESASFALSGPSGISAVGDMFYDKVFIGVDGIDPEYGLTTNHAEQAAVHRAMLRQSHRKIIVADHTKVGKICNSVITSIPNVDLIISDKKACLDLSAFSVTLVRA
jgi:DeoR family transcriptional regulator of aga operon